MGFEILDAGIRKIRLSPSLLGLDYAKVELLTPYGKVTCEQCQNKEPKLIYPKDIIVELR